jgi:hypothetical protein
MPVIATRATREALRKLPTTSRPVVDAADVVAPEGYEVEPVLVGLSFPCGMGFADDGSLFLLEGGSTWPTRRRGHDAAADGRSPRSGAHQRGREEHPIAAQGVRS